MAQMPKLLVCYHCKNIQLWQVSTIQQHCDRCGRLIGVITIVFKDRTPENKIIKKEVS